MIFTLAAAELGYFDFLFTHLSKEDAEVVHVIHTASRTYGAPIQTGHVSFKYNGKILKKSLINFLILG